MTTIAVIFGIIIGLISYEPLRHLMRWAFERTTVPMTPEQIEVLNFWREIE